MSVLGPHFAWQIQNSTGVIATVTVKVKYGKYTTTGAFDFSPTETTVHNGVAVAANGTSSRSTTVNNTTDDWTHAYVSISATLASAGTGTVAVRLVRSTDDGTTWPDAGVGPVVVSLSFAGTSALKNDTNVVR